MPRKVVTLVTCSLCGEEGIEHNGEPEFETAKIEFRKTAYSLDLCPACQDNAPEFTWLLDRSIQSGAKRKSKPKPKTEPVQEMALVGENKLVPVDKLKCGVCDYVAKAPQGRGAHMRAAHGIGAKPKEKASGN